jgi:predicted PurR-regulated permease PerM
MNLLKSDPSQTLIWTAIAALAGYVVYQLAPVLTPFLLAAILAYMLNPGVDFFCRRRVPRWAATLLMIVLVLTGAVLLVLIILPVLQHEVLQLQQKLPQLLGRLNQLVAPKLSQWFGLKIDFSANALRNLISAQWNTEDIVTTVLQSIKVGGLALAGWVATLFLVPIVLFYLLIDWYPLLSRLEAAVPRRWHSQVVEMAAEIDGLLAQFLRGQLLVMILLAAYYSIALAIAGFDVALPVGLFTGLLAFVPYLGFSVGLLLAVLAALLQFTDVATGLIIVGVIYGIGQLLETYVFTPRLVGNRIGLHPLAVIFALLAFGELFGFAGVLLALPASAALLVGLRRIKAMYLGSDWYRRPPT